MLLQKTGKDNMFSELILKVKHGFLPTTTPNPKANIKMVHYNYQHRCKERKRERKEREGKVGKKRSKGRKKEKIKLLQTSKYK